ncbi:laminin subunit alpha-3 [Elysia marginata]|uniref:Laminin subunit alpha-3 n=1 Tax=Elysia marginata TaxID=1093978 RepID=A0AAV4GU11_9GAST|nr:laminin subunit alpha-3 [Elysia marginata]
MSVGRAFPVSLVVLTALPASLILDQTDSSRYCAYVCYSDTGFPEEDDRAERLNSSLDGVMSRQPRHRHTRTTSPTPSTPDTYFSSSCSARDGSPRRQHKTPVPAAGGSNSARLPVKSFLHDRPPMSLLDSDSGVGSYNGRSGLSRSRSLSRLHTSALGSGGGDSGSSLTDSQLGSSSPMMYMDRSWRELQTSLEDSESRRTVLMAKLKEAQTTLELQGDRLKKIESSARDNSLLVEDLKKKEKDYRMKISQLESAEKDNKILQMDNMRLREEMQERISSLDYQLKYLKSQHHNSESENNKRISLLDHTTMALSLLEEENSKLQQEKEKLHSEIALLRDAFCLTKTRFGALEEENKNIRNESVRVKEDNSALSKKVQEMAGQMIELRSLLQAVKDENERLSTTWKSSAEDKSRAARQVEGYQDTINDIKSRLAATSADRDRLFQEKLEMNGKLQQMVLDKEQLMKAKLNLEDQLTELQESKPPGTSSRALDVRRDFDKRELNKELASVKKVSEELSAELSLLKGQYERSLEQIASLERSKAMLQSQSDLGEQERRRMQSEMDRLNQSLSDKTHEQSRANDYQDETIHRLRSDLKETRYQKNEYENKIQELEARLAQANEGLREGTALQHSELDTWKNTCERLTSSVTRKESELQNLTDRCHEMEDTVSGLRQEMRALKDKNDMLSDRDEEAERLREEVRRLLQEKAENEQMIRLLETQKSVLTKSVSFRGHTTNSRNVEECRGRGIIKTHSVNGTKRLGNLGESYDIHFMASKPTARKIESLKPKSQVVNTHFDSICEDSTKISLDSQSNSIKLSHQKAKSFQKNTLNKTSNAVEKQNFLSHFPFQSVIGDFDLPRQGLKSLPQTLQAPFSSSEFEKTTQDKYFDDEKSCCTDVCNGYCDFEGNLDRQNAEQELTLFDSEDSILKSLNFYDDFKFWEQFFEKDILAYAEVTETGEHDSFIDASSDDGAVKVSEDNLGRLSELEHLSEQIDKLRADNEQLRKSKFDLEMTRDSLVQEKDDILANSESMMKNSNLSELEGKIEELRDANRQLREMNETLTQKLETLDQENSSLKQTVTSGTSKVEADKLREENTKLQAEYNDLKHEYGALDAKHQRFVINYGHDGDVAAREKQDMIKLRKERDATQKQVTLLQGQLSLMEGSKRRSDEQLSKMTAELGEARAQIKQRDSNMNGNFEGEGASRQETERLRRELEAARENIRVQEKMMKNLREESLEDVSSELQQMRGKLQELVGEIERKDHTIETLESDLRRARGEAEVRSEEVAHMREAVGQMETENEALRQEVIQIRDSLAADLAPQQKQDQVELKCKKYMPFAFTESLQEELAEAVKAKQNGTYNKNRNQGAFLSKSLSSINPRPASAPAGADGGGLDRPATEGSHRLQSLISKYRSHGDKEEQGSSASSPTPGDGLRGIKPLPGFVASKIVSPKGRFGGGAGGGLGGGPSKSSVRRSNSQEGSGSQETPISPLARQDGVVLGTAGNTTTSTSLATTRPGRKLLPPPPTSPKPVLPALASLAASSGNPAASNTITTTSSAAEPPSAPNTASTTTPSTKSSFMRTMTSSDPGSSPSTSKPGTMLGSPRREKDSSPLASLRATLPSTGSKTLNSSSNANTGSGHSSGLGQSLSASLVEGPLSATPESGDHKEINALIQK